MLYTQKVPSASLFVRTVWRYTLQLSGVHIEPRIHVHCMYITTFSIGPPTSSACSFSCSKAGTMCSHQFPQEEELVALCRICRGEASFTNFRYTR
ncbi:hypothetical protein DPMN_188734 [Dreissena polymorpha]|uniref:Uncharacterized protein n=1 Tax=Dreissena polymorpha TaxID=45954 RepID=A0A9D4IA75_DREPO|nr:hypothetical protein DPMN_188734 [Dreissena polymorpha]